MARFETICMVDWSAAGSPKTGKDSIWIAVARGGAIERCNPATRAEAEHVLSETLATETAAGRRALVGFDFPFGYPPGLADKIAHGGDWSVVWDWLERNLTDGPDNANDRFDLAARLNALFEHAGPFWGNGLKREIDGLPRTRPEGYGRTLPPLDRHCDATVRSAQEVWKLSGAGSVGGQALTGLPVVERLRRAHPLAIWPFEPAAGAHVAAEVYPSLIPVVPKAGEVRDAAQVATLARAFARAEACGLLERMLAAPLAPAERRETATMLGLSHLDDLRRASAAATGAPMRRYLKDPEAIYAQSFATVRSEARLDRFPADLRPLVVRLIHACGMTDVADRLAFSPDVARSGAAALAGGAPILCDCEMVAAGIIRDRLPARNEVVVTLNAPSVPALARRLGTTRSAAAVELWSGRVGGAVVAIGNAPTALFHLLERLDDGWPKPAAILGLPVGFVGAAESKAELAANPRATPFLALRGRRGGSAMASAAVNALAAGLPGEAAA